MTLARLQPAGLPRALEISMAIALLLFSAPVLVGVALAVAIASPGPIIFRQWRMGKDGRPFEILKFRSMRQANEGPAVTATGDPRVTRIGWILRRSKLDELPVLWNVVRGDMSLVGPRPEAVRYVDLSNELWQDVLRVRPGITDPVTLRLRNEEALLGAVTTNQEMFYREHLLPYKLAASRKYIANRTWTRDVSVLSLTILSVLFPGRVTAPSLDEITRDSPDTRSGSFQKAGTV